jgi:hypothetical protein
LFHTLIGATPEQAQTYLQISEGDVEAAVGLYMESDGMDYQAAASEHERRTTTTTNPTSSVSPQLPLTSSLTSPLAPPASVRSNSQFPPSRYSADSVDLTRDLDEDGVRAAIAPRRDVLMGGDDFYHSGSSSGNYGLNAQIMGHEMAWRNQLDQYGIPHQAPG